MHCSKFDIDCCLFTKSVYSHCLITNLVLYEIGYFQRKISRKHLVSIEIVSLIYISMIVAGAMVQMTCKNTKHSRVVVTATTDNNGYFWLASKDVSSHAYHRCKVYNVKSSDKNCTITSKMNGGIEGAELKPVKAFLDVEKKPVVLYRVGPLAYEPTCPR